MDFKIEAPVEGKVVLEMNWQEAEIATRLLGMANSGNLQTYAPGLHEFVLSMVEHVGRNTRDEAKGYTVEVAPLVKQLFIESQECQ